MSIFGRIFGGSGSNNPDRGTDTNQQLIRMQQNIREEFVQELRSEVENDENFESQINKASSLRDIDQLIRTYEDRHQRMEDQHGNIESKTSILENKLREAENQGLQTQAVVAARTNVQVLENTEGETEEELTEIDEALKDLDQAVKSGGIELDSAKGRLDQILEKEENFITKVETQMEHEWMDQYS